MRYKDNLKDRFSFPVNLEKDCDEGGYVVTFRDLPEAITQGDSLKMALEEASDCLEEAIAARISDRLEIPTPSEPQEHENVVTVPLQTAFKAAIAIVMSESQMSQVQLAKILQVNEKEVRRILDPSHGTKLATMEKTLNALGQKIVLCLI